MTIRFKKYGELEYIEPEEFYSMNAMLCGTDVAEDGKVYDIILISTDNGQRLACGNI